MASTAGDRVFLRKASGLIKTASNTDVFIYDIGLVSIGLGLGFLLFFGPAVYLSGNLYVATILAGVAMLAVGLGMLTWTITIPRSGGIYNFGLESFGANQLAGHWGTFIIASLALIVGAIILASGMRRFFFTQKVMFTMACIGTLIFLGTLIGLSRGTFVNHFNSLMGQRLGVGRDAYHGVINAATKAGWHTGGFDWSRTLELANWAFLPLIGAAFSISIGGEIKQVTRGQTLGILGAVVGAVAVWIISYALIFRTMGSGFLGAVTYSNFNAVHGASTPVTPYPTLLTGLGSDSVTLTILIALGFIGWIWLGIPAPILLPPPPIAALAV